MLVYIINYDPLILPTYQLTGFIDSNESILNWYLPFNGTCVVVSNLTHIQLTDILAAQFYGHQFLTIISGSWNTGGRMPPAAWDFINNPKLSPKRAQANEFNGLTGLFNRLPKV